MTNKQLRFISYVKKKCRENGIKCDIRNVTYVKGGENIKCSGYFDEMNRILVVSKMHPDFFHTLIHEYCHVLQWKENGPLWKNIDKSSPLVDKWLTGKSVKNYKKHLAAVRDMELDCEKRAVELMKKWNFPINDYVKKANAYVQFYNWLAKTRRWSSPENSPYTNKIIVSAMPNKFNMDYSKMSKRIEKLFKQENI